MSSGVTQTIESLIGPPSEPISVSEFLTSDEHARNRQAVAATTQIWNGLSEEERQQIERDCSVDDLKENLERTWDDPTLSTYILKEHESSANALYQANPKGRVRSSRKSYLPDPEDLPTEVLNLQKEFDKVPLESWKTNLETSLFVRPPRNADYNTLESVKSSFREVLGAEKEHQAVLTASIYSKVPWGPSYVTRICQHASPQEAEKKIGVREKLV
ncbi:hypothetical protein CC1G_14134 [Coprinopsis cinerea okayama7|uniref:Uncharacterized protein n=1 Tax=Coprinopsis cinerea (strain Okayama-7 / 130 / ATCC MYA-4618 / FGSC 9003) TaxID=240176 RepID=D6RLB9_COPC7|nr:hypothetical protein CC1G_14134 [Coprinopsis cinerea okayama7\|eukprot:XP_002911601.1 hypothetical protein CC1G_14134 [Coprinopsis cinerea okayama7\